MLMIDYGLEQPLSECYNVAYFHGIIQLWQL